MFHILDFIRQMSKLRNSFWLEKVVFFLEETGKKPEKLYKGNLPTVLPYTTSPLRTITTTLSKLEIFSQKISYVKNQRKCIQISILMLCVTYHEGFIMNTGNKHWIVVYECSSFSQQLMSWPLVYDSRRNKFFSSTDWFKRFQYCKLGCSNKYQVRIFHRICN